MKIIGLRLPSGWVRYAISAALLFGVAIVYTHNNEDGVEFGWANGIMLTSISLVVALAASWLKTLVFVPRYGIVLEKGQIYYAEHLTWRGFVAYGYEDFLRMMSSLYSPLWFFFQVTNYWISKRTVVSYGVGVILATAICVRLVVVIPLSILLSIIFIPAYARIMPRRSVLLTNDYRLIVCFPKYTIGGVGTRAVAVPIEKLTSAGISMTTDILGTTFTLNPGLVSGFGPESDPVENIKWLHGDRFHNTMRQLAKYQAINPGVTPPPVPAFVPDWTESRFTSWVWSKL